MTTEYKPFDPINTTPGSRAGIDDSDFNVIRCTRQQIIVALCLSHAFTALLFMTIGWFMR